MCAPTGVHVPSQGKKNQKRPFLVVSETVAGLRFELRTSGL